ncbi:MAG: FtsW/RodA/SpoVE family cell cycle protein [Clostridia bacterium]|nr:FtsW/RodA/SpoVE family cell cycle protein [Clostridia bacterium]
MVLKGCDRLRSLLARIADFIRESDKILLFLCFFASVYGCLAVFSAVRYKGSYRAVLVQSICVALGVVAAVVISAVDYAKILERWYLIAIAGLIPVILTFFIGFAPEGTDDKAWLNIGFTAFQPSELLKICFIVTFSQHLSRVKPTINKLKTLLPDCLHGAFPVLLIHIQGDDGTALVFAVMVLFMMWAAGVSWKYFLLLLITAAIVSPLFYFFVMNPDQQERIFALFDPNADTQGILYQQWRGKMALANGGLFGQGYLKGDLTQAGTVPMGHNDFIFVSIGEEFGFLGCMVVILLLGAICLRCIRIARLCSKESGKLICVGMFSILFAQMVINIGMCVQILPVIGITLPFFSAGGTSLLCLYLGIGLVLNVYCHRNSRTIYLHDDKV